jgi:preprotein translocase subunit SecE
VFGPSRDLADRNQVQKMAVSKPQLNKQQVNARKPMAPLPDKGPAPAPPARGRGFAQFFHEVIVELRKTTWPTPKEAWRLTSVVLGVILVVAVYIGTIDFVLSFLTKKFNLIK